MAVARNIESGGRMGISPQDPHRIGSSASEIPAITAIQLTKQDNKRNAGFFRRPDGSIILTPKRHFREVTIVDAADLEVPALPTTLAIVLHALRIPSR